MRNIPGSAGLVARPSGGAAPFDARVNMAQSSLAFLTMLKIYKRLVGELGLTNGDKSFSDLSLDDGVDIAPQYDSEQLLQLACSRPSSLQDSRVVLLGEIRDRFDALATKVHEAHLEVALGAIAAVERERFIPPEYTELAYLPMNGDIGFGQTISNPHVVAAMVAAAEPDSQSVVLEVGTGCGYQAAVANVVAVRLHGKY